MRRPLLEEDMSVRANLSDFLRSDDLVDWRRLFGDAAALEQEPGNKHDVPSESARGMDSGAEDYMATPLEELAARIRAVQGRNSGSGGLHAGSGEVELDLNTRTAFVNGTPIGLTAREWAVLEALALHAGRAVTKRDLEALALGRAGDGSSNAVQVYVSRIRNKLGRELIETLPGIGYRIAG